MRTSSSRVCSGFARAADASRALGRTRVGALETFHLVGSRRSHLAGHHWPPPAVSGHLRGRGRPSECGSGRRGARHRSNATISSEGLAGTARAGRWRCSAFAIENLRFWASEGRGTQTQDQSDRGPGTGRALPRRLRPPARARALRSPGLDLAGGPHAVVSSKALTSAVLSGLLHEIERRDSCGEGGRCGPRCLHSRFVFWADQVLLRGLASRNSSGTIHQDEVTRSEPILTPDMVAPLSCGADPSPRGGVRRGGICGRTLEPRPCGILRARGLGLGRSSFRGPP